MKEEKQKPIPGKSMLFIGKSYKDTDISCYLDDQVVIHPVPGVSQGTKSYPGKIYLPER